MVKDSPPGPPSGFPTSFDEDEEECVLFFSGGSKVFRVRVDTDSELGGDGDENLDPVLSTTPCLLLFVCSS